MSGTRVTIHMTDEEVALCDKAAGKPGATLGHRPTRSSIIREGAKRYACELLGIKPTEEEKEEAGKS